MKRNPVAFDQNAIGASLVLLAGNTTLQTAASADAHRSARSAFGQRADKSEVAFYIYSPNLAAGILTAAPSLVPVAGVPPLTVGFGTVDMGLGKYVGEDANAWGYCPGDGKVYKNGAVVATWTTSPLSTWITITFDFVSLSATFAAGGTVLGNITLSAATTYYYAATVSGSAGDLAVRANAGQTPLPYTQGGWFHPRTGVVPLYLATEPYITQPNDELPNFKFAGDVDSQSRLTVSRGVHFWPWGASAPSQFGHGGRMTCGIDDPNEIYGELITADIRDELVVFNRVAQGGSFDAAEQIYTGIIDSCQQTTDQTKTLNCVDKATLLQGQLIRPLYAPDADPSVAGKPRPFNVGTVRTFAPDLYDAAHFYYGASGRPIAGVGNTRMMGAQMALGIDYTQLPDAQGFSLPAAPAGKWTLETSTFGGAYNVSYTDSLGGDGVFGSVAAQTGTYAGQPVNWTAGGGYPNDPHNIVMQVTGTAPNKFVRQAQKAAAIYWMQYTPAGGFTVAPGASIAFEVALNTVPYTGPGVTETGDPTTITPAVLGFGGMANASVQFWAWGKFSIPRAGTYTGSFTNTQSIALPLVFFFMCTSQIQGSGNYSYLDIASIKIVPLLALTQTVSFAKAPLDYLLRAIIYEAGPMDAADYDAAGAQAIDAATGYGYGVYVPSDNSPSAQTVAKRVLDSCCADIFVKRDGLITAVRLTAPEAATSIAGSLGVTDLQGYLVPHPDFAENLTTRLAGAPQPSPYAEADFADQSQTTVPQTVRKLLQQPFQWTAVGTPVASRYAAAIGASPLASQLDDIADGQAEINRVCALYSVPRNFYVGTFFSPMGREFEIGQVWNVTYPIAGLRNGQQLMIVGLSEQLNEGVTTLVFWGL